MISINQQQAKNVGDKFNFKTGAYMITKRIFLSLFLMSSTLHAAPATTYKCYLQLANGQKTLRSFETEITNKTTFMKQIRGKKAYFADGVSYSLIRKVKECALLEQPFTHKHARKLEAKLDY